MCPFEKIENLLNNFRIFFFQKFSDRSAFFFCLIYIIKSDVCLRTLECPANYSSSFYAMGYPRVPMASLWPNGGNKANWGNIQAKKNFFFQKNTLCHSFRISVIPSVLLSFLPDYCHSFRIIVIPSVLVSFLPNIVIPSVLVSFLPNIVIPS